MKKLFTAIRQGNIEEVRRILEKKPELIACIAKAPPKKDEGQSPLQVAIKSDNHEVANYLLDMGADVNFMEDHVYYENDMRAPILYDAITQLYLRSPHEVEKNEIYFALLSRLLEMGADTNKENSCGFASWFWVLDSYGKKIEKRNETDYDYEIRTKANVYYLDLTARVLEKLSKYGANPFRLPELFSEKDLSAGPTVRTRRAIFNLICNRDVWDGIITDNDVNHPYMGINENHAWHLIEPVLRPYYAKDNPYYGDKVSGEREKMFESLNHLMNEPDIGGPIVVRWGKTVPLSRVKEKGE